jgi:hypothetical protein
MHTNKKKEKIDTENRDVNIETERRRTYVNKDRNKDRCRNIQKDILTQRKKSYM